MTRLIIFSLLILLVVLSAAKARDITDYFIPDRHRHHRQYDEPRRYHDNDRHAAVGNQTHCRNTDG